MEDFPYVTFLLGIGVGVLAALAAAWIRRLLRGESADETAARRRERAYRREVADHYVKTAELVNRLTDSYKEVFDHLREGAGKLVDEETLRQRLAHQEDKDVTLHLIGYGERSAGKRPGKPGSGPQDDSGEDDSRSA